jgi:serine/threonine protein phosphatase 1
VPKTYAIGDIHACNQQLIALLSALDIQSDDTLIFLGDGIDKSMNNKEIVITSKL